MILNHKQQAFCLLVAHLLLQAEEMGYKVTFGEAWRPDEMAEWYAAHGAGIKNSLHRLRLAIDLQIFSSGKFLSTVEDYRPLGEWWEQQSATSGGYTCVWGGRFARPDADHFSFEHEGVK